MVDHQYVDPSKLYWLMWRRGGLQNPSFHLEAHRSKEGFDYWVKQCELWDNSRVPAPPRLPAEDKDNG